MPIDSTAARDPHAGPNLLLDVAMVASGGAIGALARAAVAALCSDLRLPAFVATQLVNTAGAFALGLLVGALESRAPRPHWRAFLGVGVLGSFTTYSTFVAELDRLPADWPAGSGPGAITLALAVGAAALVAGERIAARCSGRPPVRAAGPGGPR